MDRMLMESKGALVVGEERRFPYILITVIVAIVLLAFGLWWYVASRNTAVQPNPAPSQSTKLQTHTTTGAPANPPIAPSPHPSSSGATDNSSGNPKVDR